MVVNDRYVHMVTLSLSGDEIKEVFIQKKTILEGEDIGTELDRLSVIDEEDEDEEDRGIL